MHKHHFVSFVKISKSPFITVRIKNLSFQTDELFPCVHFFDIRDTFDGYDETLIYFDQGHMFDNGYAIVAKRIFDNISLIVQESS